MAAGDITAEMRAVAFDDTMKALRRMDRTPFRRLLADFIGAAPTPDNVREFAAKHPDRWAQAMSILGGLAGFERGVNVNFNVRDVGQMSDAALTARVAELERALAAGAGALIEGEIIRDPEREDSPQAEHA